MHITNMNSCKLARNWWSLASQEFVIGCTP